MSHPKQWNLGAKLTLVVGTPFLLLALCRSRSRCGCRGSSKAAPRRSTRPGACACRRIGWRCARHRPDERCRPAGASSSKPGLLGNGDPERPLFVPWDDTVRSASRRRADWRFAGGGSRPPARRRPAPRRRRLRAHIDALRRRDRDPMSRWTALLHLVQMAMMAFAVLGAAVLLYTGYLFVLEPVGSSSEAIQRIQRGDFGARVDASPPTNSARWPRASTAWPEHLQSMYRDLEAKVARRRAAGGKARAPRSALRGHRAGGEGDDAGGARRRLRARACARVARADGVALRWSDETNQRYLMLASEGLPRR